MTDIPKAAITPDLDGYAEGYAAGFAAGQARMQEAIARIKDMLEGDDGEAWFEASKFLKKIDGLPGGEVG